MLLDKIAWITKAPVIHAPIQRFKDLSEMPRNYKELKVWQKSYQLYMDLDKVTKTFPEKDGFGLTSQMIKAAQSITSNIAKGYRRKTTSEYLRSLYVAYRSTCELEMQIILSGDLGYLNQRILSILHGDICEVEKMLRAEIKSIENKQLDT
ncbi:MAG: four helix bundle protein [Desulfobacterium sp.]|nr:four helix bundle protein [Desulfobacterium sp.]